MGSTDSFGQWTKDWYMLRILICGMAQTMRLTLSLACATNQTSYRVQHTRQRQIPISLRVSVVRHRALTSSHCRCTTVYRRIIVPTSYRPRTLQDRSLTHDACSVSRQGYRNFIIGDCKLTDLAELYCGRCCRVVIMWINKLSHVASWQSLSDEPPCLPAPSPHLHKATVDNLAHSQHLHQETRYPVSHAACQQLPVVRVWTTSLPRFHLVALWPRMGFPQNSGWTASKMDSKQ